MAHALAELRYGIVAHQHERDFKYGHNFAHTLYGSLRVASDWENAERDENRKRWNTSDPGVTWDGTAYAERHLPGRARGKSRREGRGSDDARQLTASRGHGVRGEKMRCAPLPKFYRRGAHPVGLSPERPSAGIPIAYSFRCGVRMWPVSQSLLHSYQRSTWSTLTPWSSFFERGGILASFCLLAGIALQDDLLGTRRYRLNTSTM